MKPKVYFQKSLTYLDMATKPAKKLEDPKKLLNLAKTDMQKARELTPNNVKLSEEYAPYFFYMGEIYWNLDYIGMAKTEYKLAISQKPDYAEAYASLGKLFFQIKDKDNTKINLKKSLELNPNQPDLQKILETFPDSR
ncbi:MAG: hypothetical protein A2161_10900 [Candidatus Schekmanbacteria bacterium RBG_13_48_7]|uniref:Uncharacterized protein n=1 Tax=Candidatus Schekmanbacteria bacterium RBG_13_48_7 TaxID=1817878 RepID=A0A1F7RQT9_9BACT|nr:MAG: hypothetical protein A2161_10900 [Candidatus Schekmanbacteria bacterium RBG_13_48_7]